jgi:hypothetical protein
MPRCELPPLLTPGSPQVLALVGWRRGGQGVGFKTPENYVKILFAGSSITARRKTFVNNPGQQTARNSFDYKSKLFFNRSFFPIDKYLFPIYNLQR